MVNNIEKRIVLAEADPMSHMEMELTMAIQEAYENAVKNGYSGTITDWIKTAPIDEVKKINLAGGGPVKNRPKEPKVKKLNIADYFESVVDQRLNQVRVSIVSAHPLTIENIEKL